MSTDFELLDAWRDGDGEAGSQLFERHFEAVYRFFCNKAGDDIDDLVQQTFLGCVEGQQRFRKQASFRTYLFAVARNKLISHIRSKSGKSDEDLGVTSVHDLGMSPVEVVAQHEEQRLLLRALRRLPIELQVALELSYWEGLSDAVVAEILDIPTGTLKSRLRKARQHLEANMAELARSKQHLESTTGDLEGWVASIRDVMAAEPPSKPARDER